MAVLNRSVLAFVLLCGLLPLRVAAAPFDAGSFNLSVVLGEGRAFNDTYRNKSGSGLVFCLSGSKRQDLIPLW